MARLRLSPLLGFLPLVLGVPLLLKAPFIISMTLKLMLSSSIAAFIFYVLLIGGILASVLAQRNAAVEPYAIGFFLALSIEVLYFMYSVVFFSSCLSAGC